jgi:hypothetical protein
VKIPEQEQKNNTYLATQVTDSLAQLLFVAIKYIAAASEY